MKLKGLMQLLMINILFLVLVKKKVNINKSYNNMKEYGKYNPNLFIYDCIKPSISISNNKDYNYPVIKYVIGVKDEYIYYIELVFM